MGGLPERKNLRCARRRDWSGARQIQNLRYSRVQLCATGLAPGVSPTLAHKTCTAPFLNRGLDERMNLDTLRTMLQQSSFLLSSSASASARISHLKLEGSPGWSAGLQPALPGMSVQSRLQAGAPVAGEKCGLARFMSALSRTLLVVSILCAMPAKSGELEEAFTTPPPAYRPETWFHLIGGNVGRAGLTADLEAIQAAGLGGIQLFHGQFGGPWPGVEPQVTCLSPQWDGMIQHVANECARLDLRFAMENCPGWSMAGGPWIKPADAMRELIWSRTDVAGGAHVTMKLPRPQPSNEDWRDYRDVAVLAFPKPVGDSPSPLVPQIVRSNHPELPWAALFDPAKRTTVRLEPAQSPVWVEVEFTNVVTLRSLELPPVVQFTLRHDWDPDRDAAG